MSVQCLSCQGFTVKERLIHARADEEMRTLGMGRCSKDKDCSRFYSAMAPRDCATFQPVSAAALHKRQAFMAKAQQQ